MKKFDVDNLSLSNIIIILVPATFLILIWLWISGKQYDFDGVRGLAVDRNGVTHLQLAETLYRYDASGLSLPSIDLHELGVTDFVGDLSFNDRNELLIRRGRYETGFLEQLAIYFRVSNKSDLQSIDSEGLSLCNLNSKQCKAFGESTYDFNRGYFSAISPVDGAAIISDASRHQLHKFDEAGRHLAFIDDGLQFPNDMVIDQNQLYLVDTNNKAVKQLRQSTTNFGEELETHLVANPDAEERGHSWPYGLEKVGDSWWVIILDSSMDQGGVYIFDSDWRYLQALPLDAGAIPVALLNHQGEVLVSDVESDKVARYSVKGEFIGTVEHAELNANLAHNLSQRQFYKTVGLVYLLFILAVFLAAFSYAYRVSRRTALADLAEHETAAPAEKIDVENGNHFIDWIEPRSQLRSWQAVTKIQTFGLCAVLVIFGISVFYTQAYLQPSTGLRGLTTIAPVFLFVAGMLLLMTDGARVRLGMLNNKLVLHDQVTNDAYSASGHSVLYDGRRIAFGGLSLQTGTMAKQFYDNASFTKNVYPVLANACVVKPNAMQIWIYSHEKARIMETLIKLVILMLAISVLYIGTYYSEGFSLF